MTESTPRNSSTKEPAKAKPSPLPRLVGGALGLALVAVVIVWAMNRGPDAPRLNDDTVTLVKFTMTDQYMKLPFDRQALYMKVMEDRDDNGDLEKAFNSGRLNEAEYRAALMEAWLGQQLKRSERYATLPGGSPKRKYISELAQRKLKEDAQPKKPSSSAADDIRRDESLEKVRISQWPAEARMQWENFRKAYNEHKAALEEMAAGATTRAAAKAE